MTTEDGKDGLTGRNVQEGCRTFQKLMEQSRESGAGVPMIPVFLEMTRSNSSYVRTRGVLLAFANAPFAREALNTEVLSGLLGFVADPSAITARQVIAALPRLAEDRPEMRCEILEQLKNADMNIYADSMKPLLEKDRTVVMGLLKEPVALETERLILRPWHQEDAAALFSYAQDPRIGPIAGWPPHTSVENSRGIIATVLSAPETYAVVLKQTGEPVGSAGVMRQGFGSAKMTETEAEIGYWIGVPHWGRGLIPEAVRTLVAEGFRKGLTALWIGWYDGNSKSQRVAEKCGFRFHHTVRDVRSPLGDIRTAHFAILTKEDWLNNGV